MILQYENIIIDWSKVGLRTKKINLKRISHLKFSNPRKIDIFFKDKKVTTTFNIPLSYAVAWATYQIFYTDWMYSLEPGYSTGMSIFCQCAEI